MLLIELGGGRKQANDKINYHVGYNNVLSVGEKIDNTNPVVKVYSKSEDALNVVKDQIRKCFIIQDSEAKNLSDVYEKIN